LGTPFALGGPVWPPHCPRTTGSTGTTQSGEGVRLQREKQHVQMLDLQALLQLKHQLFERVAASRTFGEGDGLAHCVRADTAALSDGVLNRDHVVVDHRRASPMSE